MSEQVINIISARIGICNYAGEVASIFCNRDGNLDGVGVTLFEHYKTKERVEALLSLGNICYLRKWLKC